MPKPWFETGFEGLPEREPRGLMMPTRFYVPQGAERRIVFVDEDPIRYWEHSWYAEGNWRHFAVCLEQVGAQCPLCALIKEGRKKFKVNRYYVGLLTVIDLTPWVDRDGVQHNNTMRLFAAKTDVLASLKIRKAKTGLAGKIYTVIRTGERAPSTGNDFIFEGPADWKALGFTEPPKPYDYLEFLKPHSVEEMRKIADSIRIQRTVEHFGDVEELPPDEEGEEQDDGRPVNY